MSTNYKQLLGTLVAGLSLASWTASSVAQQYPNKPVRLIVSAPVGTAPDIMARLIGDKVEQALGQRMLVDNRPTAQGVIAMKALRESASDGYTLGLFQAAAAVVTPFTYKDANYDVERDVETVATVAYTPMMLVANGKAPAKALADLLRIAKTAKPETIAIGNPIRASIPHLAAELLGQRTGIKFRHISFSSTAQGVQALLNDDIPYYIDGPAALMQFVKAGKMTPVAVLSDRVLPGLEGIALAKDVVPDLNVYGWFIIIAPKGTPAALLQRLNAEINKAIAQPDVIEKLRALGTYPMPGSVEEAQNFVKKEKALFSNIIKEAGVTAE